MSGQGARLDRVGRLSEGAGHPLVRRLVQLINRERCGVTLVCERAGVDRKTFYDWRIDTMPAVDKLDAMGNVLGWRLAWVPIERIAGAAVQANASNRPFDLARDCPKCGAMDSHIRLFGHTQCNLCGAVIEECCP